MEKDRFNYLVHQYNSLSQEETAELRLEQDHYGYCQVLHQLIARGDQDNQTDEKEHSLNIAAVYSTDRSVLKQIMTEPRIHRVEWTPPGAEPVQNISTSTSIISAPEISKPSIVEQEVVVTKKEEPQSTYTPPPVSDFDSDAAVSRFVAELAPMREKKLAFERAMEEFERNFNKVPMPSEVKGEHEGELTMGLDHQEEKTSERPKRKYTKSKSRSSDTQASTSTNEQLLQEIKTTKKKVTPETLKQKEQIEIIDQFIKTKPSISKPTIAQVELDLTQETDTYNENVVSETLALILIKQGKKDKAIEVLRKLIWKFPQKKAYFAAQIEELLK